MGYDTATWLIALWLMGLGHFMKIIYDSHCSSSSEFVEGICVVLL